MNFYISLLSTTMTVNTIYSLVFLSFLFCFSLWRDDVSSDDLEKDSDTVLHVDEINFGSYVNLNAPTGNFALFLFFAFILSSSIFFLQWTLFQR